MKKRYQWEGWVGGTEMMGKFCMGWTMNRRTWMTRHQSKGW